jgi:hypothetical protein
LKDQAAGEPDGGEHQAAGEKEDPVADELLERPRFNHVGFTVDAGLLDEAGRKRIVDFFATCFGFAERAEYTKDREMLVLMLGGPDQFIIFFGHEQPTSANPPTDHFGMVCSSLEELKGYLEKVRSFAAADPAIEFEDYEIVLLDDERPYRLHRFYVRLATPSTLEVQYYEWL